MAPDEPGEERSSDGSSSDESSSDGGDGVGRRTNDVGVPADDAAHDPADPADADAPAEAAASADADAPSADTDAGTSADTARTPRERRERAADEKFCPSCGEPIARAAERCPACGAGQRGASASRSDGDDRTTAGVLAILLGGVGAHKFYLGNVLQGLLYLCFFWTVLPAIAGVVEGALYLSQSDEAFRQQHIE